jgi:hypothetical protein
MLVLSPASIWVYAALFKNKVNMDVYITLVFRVLVRLGSRMKSGMWGVVIISSMGPLSHCGQNFSSNRIIKLVSQCPVN